jgi:hypothetical protein
MFRMKVLAAGLAALAALATGASAQDYVKGRILVKFKESASPMEIDRAVGNVKGKMKLEPAGDGVAIIELPANANEKAQANAFRNRADVEFAEPDYIYQASFTPNDPQLGSQWHHAAIHDTEAWDRTQGSASVVIAILDSGVMSSHSDLAGQLVPGYNFYDGNTNTEDVYGHGTMVAGMAAAATNNSNGIGGVGFNCKLMPLRVTSTAGSASASNLAAALQWAADRGVRVANISFDASSSSTVTNAAQYFVNKGGVVTMAAGNSSTFNSMGDISAVLNVSSTNSGDGISGFSNTGNLIDCAAPGEYVYTTYWNGGYTGANGTSFSAPIVAGIAGLMFAANPNLSGAQCADLLRKSGDDLGAAGWDPAYGYGRVNARKAVEAATGTVGQDTTAPSVSFSSPSNNATVSGNSTVFVNATDNTAVDHVDFYIDNQFVGSKVAAPYSWNWDTTTVGDGFHNLSAYAYDLAGNRGSSSITVNVKNNVVDDTIAPSVQITSPGNNSNVGMKLTVSLAASDNVGVTRVEVYVDGSLVASDTAAPYSFNINTKKWSRGSHALVAKAYDAAGNVGTSATVTVNK